MKVSSHDDIPNMMGNKKKHVPNHQPGIDPKSRLRLRVALHISRAMGLLYGHCTPNDPEIIRPTVKLILKIVGPWEWEFDIYIYYIYMII